MSTPRHVPVLLDRVVALLAPALDHPGAVLVDATLGLGGHSEAVLAACPEARLVGIDRDPDALALAGERLAPYADRTTFVHAVYDEIPEVLDRLGYERVQGVLFDLGISSMQIDVRETELRQHLRDLVVHRVHPGEAGAVRRQSGAGHRECLRVAVDADDVGAVDPGEHGLAVAAEAERAVDEDRAVAVGAVERRREEGDDPVEHDRDVGRAGHVRPVAPRLRGAGRRPRSQPT